MYLRFASLNEKSTLVLKNEEQTMYLQIGRAHV